MKTYGIHYWNLKKDKPYLKVNFMNSNVFFFLLPLYILIKFVISFSWDILDRYEVHTISFQTFFIWALLLMVHTWHSSPLWSNLLWLQCICCTVPTTSRRPHGSPLVWVCQWPLSQPLSSPQLSHNDSLWA